MTSEIIRMYQIRPTVVVLVGENDRRYETYIQVIVKAECTVHVYFPNGKRSFYYIPYVLWRIRKHRNAVDLVFMASFNALYPQMISSFLNPENIGLFDDGAFCLLSDDERQKYLKPRLKSTALASILRRFGFYADSYFYKSVAVSYITMFPSFQSLVEHDRVIRIDPDFNLLGQLGKIEGKALGIMVGDVPSQLENPLLQAYLELIKSNKIDFVVPHPRDRSDTIPYSKLLKISVLCEHFILALVESGSSVNLFSISSTVLYSLPKNPRINKFMIIERESRGNRLSELAMQFDIKRIGLEEVEFI